MKHNGVNKCPEKRVSKGLGGGQVECTSKQGKCHLCTENGTGCELCYNDAFLFAPTCTPRRACAGPGAARRPWRCSFGTLPGGGMCALSAPHPPAARPPLGLRLGGLQLGGPTTIRKLKAIVIGICFLFHYVSCLPVLILLINIILRYF